MGSGMYGGFIVDPRPGTPQWQQEQALHVDAEYTEFIATMPGGWYVIDGKSFPDTAYSGQAWSNHSRPPDWR